MALEPGTQLGSFRISRMLGVGGMGEVYLATDLKLGRDVAVKVLPETFALDSERLARFEREAKLLAALDHPNICAVYDLGEADGTRFIVMQLLDGETLSARIAQGPVPIDKALPMFAQVAEALEAAHEQGIIHRDLKPGNIMVTEDGRVRVLDFGIAKAIEGLPTTSLEAVTTPMRDTPGGMTSEGVVLGTPVYMSPEQARGKPVDKRTDIWAFGCCLYEVLTGVPPFQGETVSDTLAQVLERDPDWNQLPVDTPPQVRVLLRKCLQKDSHRRLRDIGDALLEVSDLITESGSVKAVADAGPNLSRRPYLVAAAVVLGAVIIASTMFVRHWWAVSSDESSNGTRLVATQQPEPEPVRRYSITLPSTHPVKPPNMSGGLFPLALSPDGTVLVYVSDVGGGTQLVKRPIDKLEIQPMPGTEGALDPFFSPDGQWVGFFANDELKKVSIRGGPSVTLCAAPDPPLGGSWGDDGFIVFSSGVSVPIALRRVPAAGGAVETITTVATEAGDLYHGLPHILPGGKGLLFTAASGIAIDTMRVMVLPTEGGAPKTLVEKAPCYGFIPSGHLLYGQEKALMAAPFDADTLEITGPSTPIREVNVRLTPPGFTTLFAVTDEGPLIYGPGSEDPAGVSGDRTLVWVDRDGSEEQLSAPPNPYKYVDLSPNGRQIAVGLSDERDIWILDLERKPVTQLRLTFDLQFLYTEGVWTPDGQSVVFNLLRGGTWSLSLKTANGTGPVEALYTSKYPVWPHEWSPDGRFLFFSERNSFTSSDIWVLSLAGEPAAKPIIAESYEEDHPALSPDGRWIAYESDESGQTDVYVRPFPNVDDGKWLISTRGGFWPVWATDGRELYYHAPTEGQMMVVTIETEPFFTVGNPEVLFEGPYFFGPARPYDISPDGQRFLLIKEEKQAPESGGAEAPEAAPITELIVVENWFEEVKRLAPVDVKQ